MLRTLRLLAGALVLVLALAGLLAVDARSWHVLPRVRFGHLTPLAQAHFARQADELGRLDAPGARVQVAMYAAAARSATIVSGGALQGDTVFVNYATTMRACPRAGELDMVQVQFVREAGGWRVASSGTFPC